VNRGGVLNEGYDDQNYDYILHGDEIFAQRYILKHRIGKVRKMFFFCHIFYIHDECCDFSLYFETQLLMVYSS
jgi:hypothetical protein